jgi:hypothetical protein
VRTEPNELERYIGWQSICTDRKCATNAKTDPFVHTHETHFRREIELHCEKCNKEEGLVFDYEFQGNGFGDPEMIVKTIYKCECGNEKLKAYTLTLLEGEPFHIDPAFWDGVTLYDDDED